MSKSAFEFANLNGLILIACLLVVVFGTVFVSFPDGVTAILFVMLLSAICIIILRSFSDDKDFITRLFLLSLAVRMGFGIAVHVFDLREFFGGDALTYDYRGAILADGWLGHAHVDSYQTFAASTTTISGWGINYLVASIYFLLGKNIFAAQSFCAVIGAATAPMVYYCADKIFDNKRVAMYAAISAGFFPAMIIWSSQLLKDGLVIFLLVVVMTMVLQLHSRISFPAIILLGLSLSGILALRFYIFYMVVIAVVGSFALGTIKSNRSIIGPVLAIVILGFGLTYVGVIQLASADLDKYGDLKKVQRSRLDLATSAKSGYGTDEDVSTASGALTAIPVGLIVLMLAPFPWEATNLRQAIVMPETILWWAMMPVIISGLWFTFRHHFRKALPVLIFALMLTLAYAIFQGNVGTAYRQRTQIQVFLFIFFAVGLVIRSERQADSANKLNLQRERVDARLRANTGQHSR